jgi:hypothetical protein
MHLISTLTRLTLAAVLGIGRQASAQTMYRCGTSYQDQPCSVAQPAGSVIRGAAPSSAPKQSAPLSDAGSSSASNSDPTCRLRGIDAEKIRWAKEGGRTLQQALDADSAGTAFLQDVYARRGTAAEVRIAVEKSCHDELQRALEAARLNAAAAEILKGNSGASSAPSSGAASSADASSTHH